MSGKHMRPRYRYIRREGEWIILRDYARHGRAVTVRWMPDEKQLGVAWEVKGGLTGHLTGRAWLRDSAIPRYDLKPEEIMALLPDSCRAALLALSIQEPELGHWTGGVINLISSWSLPALPLSRPSQFLVGGQIHPVRSPGRSKFVPRHLIQNVTTGISGKTVTATYTDDIFDVPDWWPEGQENPAYEFVPPKTDSAIAGFMPPSDWMPAEYEEPLGMQPIKVIWKSP